MKARTRVPLNDLEKIKSASKSIFHKQNSRNELAVYAGYMVAEIAANGGRSVQN